MQKLQLTIPEPCHENWQQMTPTEQGRFCNACAKEVIDFSTMTDIQVLNYFTNLTHEKVCGRALPEQLDRTLSRPEPPKKRLFWYWNYFVMFFMFFGKGNSLKAQSTAKQVTEISPGNIAGVRGEVNILVEKRIVTGKVIDKDGNVVSFASVRVKGTNIGAAADANGAYSLRVHQNAVLIISGAGYKEAEVLVGTQTVLYTVMEKSGIDIKEVVVTVAGGIKRTIRCGTSIVKTIAANSSINFKVKEDGTDLLINKAVINITRKRDGFFEKYFSDTNGICEFKQTNLNDNYLIKVEAEGYSSNEFAINAIDFTDRKKGWEVLLKKEKLTGNALRQSNMNNALAGKVPGILVRSQSATNLGKETRVRVGGISVVNTSKKPIYVVDGLIVTDADDVNPDNIEDISFLNTAEATALFGIKGGNGAIVITNKKLPVKNLDTVMVTALAGRRRGATSIGGMVTTTTCTTTSVMGAMIKGVTVKSSITDSLKTLTTKITGAIKVYPNPVQHGESLNVALKLKQPGLYFMQITDATGRIMLQKQINTNLKEHTEQVMPDSRWSSGTYFISILDSKNKLVNKSGFIFR